jgi:Polypeptide deformylase
MSQQEQMGIQINSHHQRHRLPRQHSRAPAVPIAIWLSFSNGQDARDRNIDGNPQTAEAEGLRAVCHQHEIDQLNRMFWIQRLSRLKRERLIKRFEKLSRE